MSTQELVKISRRFIGRVKFTSQDLDHFSHTSGSGKFFITFGNLHPPGLKKSDQNQLCAFQITI